MAILRSSVVANTESVYVSLPRVTVKGTVPTRDVSSNTNALDTSSIMYGSCPLIVFVTSSVTFESVSVTTFELLTVVDALAVGFTQTRWYK